MRLISTTAVLSVALATILMGGAPKAAPQASPSFSGTWYGSFDVLHPDGKLSHDTAAIVIEQHGSAVTGSAGPSIDQQTAFTNGIANGNDLRFHLDSGDTDFNLHWQPGHLEGAATGKGLNAKLSLQPAYGLLPHAQLTEEIANADRQMFAAFEACDPSALCRLLQRQGRVLSGPNWPSRLR
jgi:hypothetical protein